MNSIKHKISIVTVCFNIASTIKKTCESIKNQSNTNFEWIVIDGGSTDGTLEILKEYNEYIDVLISEKDYGIYNAMNKGIDNSTAEYILFINGGDYLYKNDVIEHFYQYCQNNDSDIIYGDICYVKKEKSKIVSKKNDIITLDYFINNLLFHQATFIKKTLFNKFGKYDEQYKIVADWEKWIVFFKNNSSFSYFPYVVASYNTGGFSWQHPNLYQKERKIVLQYHFSAEQLSLTYEKTFFSVGNTSLIKIKSYPNKYALTLCEIPIYKKIINSFGKIILLFGIPIYIKKAYKEPAIYLFDMDGTLTPPRLPMDDDFKKLFMHWVAKNKAYIVTGSDVKKITEQLDEDSMKKFTGIYANMGNSFVKKNKIIYQNDISIPDDLLEDLENFRKNTKYPHKLHNNYIEKRIGMVNFSVLGRDCNTEERLQYEEWDNTNKERLHIKQTLEKKFTDFDFSIGGSISIDITYKNKGKEQVAFEVRKNYPNHKIVFFGDKTQEGGNDHSIAQALTSMDNTEVVSVKSYFDVINYIYKLK